MTEREAGDSVGRRVSGVELETLVYSDRSTLNTSDRKKLALDLRDARAEIETLKEQAEDNDERIEYLERCEVQSRVRGNDCIDLQRRVVRLIAEIERKDKALAFYGDEANHERPKRLRSAAFACLSDVYGDKGAIARAALKPAGEETDSG